jgi:hypothetical protein
MRLVLVLEEAMKPNSVSDHRVIANCQRLATGQAGERIGLRISAFP